MTKRFNNILLTGASGQLGRAILSSGIFKNILTPSRNELNITDRESVNKFFHRNSFLAVIHTAAMARMAKCEKDPLLAIKTNVLGTANLVEAVLDRGNVLKKAIRFLHISTDGVYSSQ